MEGRREEQEQAMTKNKRHCQSLTLHWLTSACPSGHTQELYFTEERGGQQKE